MSKEIVITALNCVAPDSLTVNSETYSKNDESQFYKTNFDTRAILGKKGTRSMDKLTGLTVHCIENLLPQVQSQLEAEPERIGLVVGTAQGSMDSIMRFTHETLAHDSPDYVNPALFPNTVMNCAAGQSAIWHGFQGPNATISCGEISSFAALNYAVSLLTKGYVDTLVAGGSEELSEVNIAAKTSLAKKHNRFAKFTEGSAFFVIEANDIATKYQRPVIATVNSVKTGYNPVINDATALTELIEQALEEANMPITEIDMISYSGAWPQTVEVEQLTLNKLLDDSADTITKIAQYELSGNAVSSQNAFQLSTVIERLAPNQRGLLFAQDLKGNTGVMIVTKHGVTGDKL